MPPGRLSIAHTESSMGWGGQEMRILRESAGMLARGHDVVVYAAPGSRIAAEAPRFGVPAIALPIAAKRIRGIRALAQALRQRPVHVVNSHSSTDSWLAALACLALRCTGTAAPALVRTRHVSVPVKLNVATRWLYRNATARIVTTGESLRRALVDDLHLDSSRVRSVPTGIDLGRFSPGDRGEARRALGLDPSRPHVGIVATLRSWKGHLVLLDAIASLARKDVVLVIVGDGPMRNIIEPAIHRLGLDARVVLAGQQDDPAPWFRSFDVFALPSYANEGVPQALMQAMACGLPVVSTPVGSIGEIVVDGRNGLMVEPRDAASLASAIERLLAGPALGARLAAAARDEALARFSDERMLDAMESVFRDAIAS